MPETSPELSATRLTDRELLIHALQHLEDLSEKLADLEDMRTRVLRIDAKLQVFEPLLDRLAPGGKADAVSIGQMWREMRRGGRGL